MKILVIGAKGMLGQELVQVMSEESEVTAWDREEIDITKAEEARYKIYDLRPEVIINAAAYNNVDKAESEPAVADEVNGYAVGTLAKICKGLDINLVHYSTEYVFDGEKKEGYLESDSPNPLSAYGRSKLLGEEELQKNTSKFYLLRLSRLFGKPALVEGAKKSFVETMLELSEKQKEIEVVDEEASSPTYAKDLAIRTRYILQEALPHGIYHCTNEGSCTWYGFAKAIFEMAGKNVKLKAVSSNKYTRPAIRPKYAVLLNTKLPPMRTWQEALREYLAA